MDDLESQIRQLSLQTPSSELDSRIHAALNSSPCDRGAEADRFARRKRSEGAASRTESAAIIAGNEPGDLQYPFAVGKAGWATAVASLLIGFLLGRSVPSGTGLGEFDSTRPSQNLAAPQTVGDSAGVSHEVRKGHVAEETYFPAADLENSASRTLQGPSALAEASLSITELPWIPAMAAVTAWEQRTGQVFNVATHVGDRRFNLCRECHRIGG
jgi:hypothetical protein